MTDSYAWQLVPLGQVIRSAQSGFASGERASNGVIQIRMNNVTTDGNLEWTSFIRVPTSPKQLSKYRLQPGDVLFNATNSPELVGKTATFSGQNEPVVFSNHFVRLRVDVKRLDSSYLARWLTYQQQQGLFESLCTQWVNQAAVRKDDLLSLRIPLPPLPEQQRIAAILARADRLRRLRRYALDLGDSYLQSVFLQMFGDCLESDYPTTPLGKLVTITGGGTPSRDVARYYEGTIPWLTSKDMRGDYIVDTQEHVTEEAIRNSATKLVPAGSILIVVKSKILMHRLPIAIGKRALCHGQDVKSIQCSERVDPLFIVHILKHNEARILAQARGANTEGLTLPMLQGVSVPDVPLTRQQQFARIVHQFERLRAQQREAQRQAEHLFQTLLHRAFQGEL
jgi:type I restriction enzyme S subunit